jgi:hypothetical protein
MNKRSLTNELNWKGFNLFKREGHYVATKVLFGVPTNTVVEIKLGKDTSRDFTRMTRAFRKATR